MKPINLATLDAKRPPVEWNGVTYPVRPITPRIAGLLDAAREVEGAVAKMHAYYDAVALLVPSMPRELVDDLCGEQVAAIVEVASGEVTAVEDAVTDPNATGSTPSAALASSEPAAPAT